MPRMRLAVLIVASLLLQPIVNAHGEIEGLRSLFAALVSQPDNASIPDLKRLMELLDKEFPKATSAEIETMAPLIQKCLTSGRSEVKTDAMVFLMAVRSRFDSAQLLEPYVDYLNTLFDSGNDADKRTAISLLGGALLKPSPRELAVLAAHLNDEKNTGEEFGMIGSALIRAFPTDPAVIHKVLERVQRYPVVPLESILIQEFGLLNITNEEALALIRAGFQNSSIRRGSINALERMPKEVRDRFVPELQRAAGDPDEAPDTRSAAQRVLIQP